MKNLTQAVVTCGLSFSLMAAAGAAPFVTTAFADSSTVSGQNTNSSSTHATFDVIDSAVRSALKIKPGAPLTDENYQQVTELKLSQLNKLQDSDSSLLQKMSNLSKVTIYIDKGDMDYVNTLLEKLSHVASLKSIEFKASSSLTFTKAIEFSHLNDCKQVSELSITRMPYALKTLPSSIKTLILNNVGQLDREQETLNSDLFGSSTMNSLDFIDDINLDNLESLTIKHCYIYNLGPDATGRLKNNTSLKTLDLSFNDIVDPSFLLDIKQARPQLELKLDHQSLDYHPIIDRFIKSALKHGSTVSSVQNMKPYIYLDDKPSDDEYRGIKITSQAKHDDTPDLGLTTDLVICKKGDPDATKKTEYVQNVLSTQLEEDIKSAQQIEEVLADATMQALTTSDKFKFATPNTILNFYHAYADLAFVKQNDDATKDLIQAKLDAFAAARDALDGVAPVDGNIAEARKVAAKNWVTAGEEIKKTPLYTSLAKDARARTEFDNALATFVELADGQSSRDADPFAAAINEFVAAYKDLSRAYTLKNKDKIAEALAKAQKGVKAALESQSIYTDVYRQLQAVDSQLSALSSALDEAAKQPDNTPSKDLVQLPLDLEKSIQSVLELPAVKEIIAHKAGSTPSTPSTPATPSTPSASYYLPYQPGVTTYAAPETPAAPAAPAVETPADPRETAGSWDKKGDSWVFVKADGSLARSEWVRKNGSWFFAKEDGTIAENEWAYVNGSWFFAKDGGYIAENEWVYVNGAWYYAQDGGYIAQDTEITIDGTTYTFDESGAWVE